jgi:hypothetical protein
MEIKKSMLVIWLSILMFVITGCFQEFIDVELNDIPITLLNDSKIVDLDLIIENSTTQIGKWLPDAKYAGIVYLGNCKDS